MAVDGERGAQPGGGGGRRAWPGSEGAAERGQRGSRRRMCGRAGERDPTAGVTNARGGTDGARSRGRARARIGRGHGEQQAEASGLRRVSAARGTQGVQGASGRRAQGGEGVQEGVPHMGSVGGC